MRKLYAMLAVTVFCSGVVMAADAVTVTGEGKCAKCALKETKDCQNTITVEDKDGKKTTYYLAKNKVSNDFHKSGGICSGTVKTTATGEVEEKDGKKVLTATKIEKAK